VARTAAVRGRRAGVPEAGPPDRHVEEAQRIGWAGAFLSRRYRRRPDPRLQAAGSKISFADLERYQARFIDPVEIAYRDAKVYAPSGLHGRHRPLKRVLDRVAGAAAERRRAGGGALCDLCRSARPRLSRPPREHGRQRQRDAAELHQPFLRRRQEGNVVAWTQTLLSRFGSFVLSPYDRHPDEQRRDVVRPGAGQDRTRSAPARGRSATCARRCAVAKIGALALGASGGRKIMPSVAQILSFMLDFGMDLDRAFHCPRIDVSGGESR
jgi:gamma-glutamyltranspeptidase/glutathione hydrolase